MTVQLACPHCRQRYHVREDRLGSETACKKCGRRFTLVDGTARSAPAPAAAEMPRAAADPYSTVPPAFTESPFSLQQIGRFVVQEQLGAGAFGTVYRAHDPLLKRDVALKTPHLGSLETGVARDRFVREAQAAARLQHPHIVPVFEAGFEGNQFYIASAFIAGPTLSAALRQQPFDWRRAARVAAQLADALHHAHQQGIVHRDVKPANVMLNRQGQPMLMDFGLARLAESRTELTAAGAWLGTPAYMAPEQTSGGSSAQGPAADQYSLGVLLYQLLCGRLPFEGAPLAVIYQAREMPPPPPRSIQPDIPPEIEAICLRALAKQPADRFADCGELAARLEACLALPPTWRDAAPPETAPMPAESVPPPFAGTAVPALALAPFSAADAARHQAAWAAHLGRPVQETNSVGMELILIPPGEFLMGSPEAERGQDNERPQHRVRIGQPFFLGKTVVTQGAWRAVMNTQPWGGQQSVQEGDDYPATYVSWGDATEFCRQLSEREGKTHRLPTEAEWEYAIRAGSTTAFHFGESETLLGTYAWYGANTWCAGNAVNVNEMYAHRAGLKGANPFGLHDMHGNVCEWCSDWYDEKYYKSLGSAISIDPTGPGLGSFRVLRGGSWNYVPLFVRCAYRCWNTPEPRSNYIGFRVVSAAP